MEIIPFMHFGLKTNLLNGVIEFVIYQNPSTALVPQHILHNNAKKTEMIL